MSGFIAVAQASELCVINDGWWPDIDASQLRAAQRIDSSVSDTRLQVAITGAMITVNRDLVAFKACNVLLGYKGLAEVPADTISGASYLVQLYNRAVSCLACSELSERYRSYDTTNAGSQNADELTPSIDEYRRDARWAIRDLLGLGRTTVELI
jgi:hypothetical protein